MRYPCLLHCCKHFICIQRLSQLKSPECFTFSPFSGRRPSLFLKGFAESKKSNKVFILRFANREYELFWQWMIFYYYKNSNKYLFVIHETSRAREIQFSAAICNISGKEIVQHGRVLLLTMLLWVLLCCWMMRVLLLFLCGMQPQPGTG